MEKRREDKKDFVRAGDILEQNFLSITPDETRNIHPPPKPTEFANTQLSLFQNVLCNTDDERERFSNAIDLWDSVPRYSVSRQAQAKARENGKFLRGDWKMPVYAMSVGKGGLKVKALAEGACTPLDLTHPPPPPQPGDSPPNFCGVMTMGPAGKGDMMLEVRGATMAQFAQRLSGAWTEPLLTKRVSQACSTSISSSRLTPT